MEDLAPGFRFYPTEEELVSFYLHHKLQGMTDDLSRAIHRVIPALDIYRFNPWDLPEVSGDLCPGDSEQWFFFNPRQESEIRTGKPKRLTNDGYWKSTGSPGYVYSSNNRCIGVKRTMIFYRGRVPNGRKTEWKMNEYKAIQAEEAASSSTGANPMLRHEFSLCRVYKKSKCRRAFDRRPIGVEPQDIGKPTTGGQARTTHQKHSLEEDRRSTLFQGSFQQDCGCPSLIWDNSNMKMAIENELVWDWDMFNCGFDEENMQIK